MALDDELGKEDEKKGGRKIDWKDDYKLPDYDPNKDYERRRDPDDYEVPSRTALRNVIVTGVLLTFFLGTIVAVTCSRRSIAYDPVQDCVTKHVRAYGGSVTRENYRSIEDACRLDYR